MSDAPDAITDAIVQQLTARGVPHTIHEHVVSLIVACDGLVAPISQAPAAQPA